MKCDKCGAPSVYHSTLIVNGVSKNTNLCRDCALKEGVFNQQKTSLFDEMFSSFSDLLGYEQVENVVCPVCKTSLREFKSTGRLGCPNCYDVFRSEVLNIVKRIAPFETHKQDAIKAKVKPEQPSKEDKIRGIGISFNNVVAENMEYYDLFTDTGEVIKERTLERTINDIKKKFGKNAVLKGMNLLDGATTIKRNDLIGGHNAERKDED